MQFISVPKLVDLLKSDIEFALLDVRERNPYSKGHVLLSTCVPLGQLEMVIGDLVPRLATRIVLIGEGPSDQYQLAERAWERLKELGYTDVAILTGGLSACREAGFEFFSGNGSYSKAFGEWVAVEYNTPFVTAEDEHERLNRGEKQVILDSRPKNEYHRMTIPGSISAPGAELAYRVHDVTPDEKAQVIVNCAGRTRSIIGAQSLVNAGIPNPVAALKNGTMGWQLAGFSLEYGQTRAASPPTPKGLAKAKQCAERVAKRFGVRKVNAATLKKWMEEGEKRTTYVFDVRLPEEYAEGHFEGSRNAQGGQLVQATDEYVSVFNARMVLLDDTEVRAIMTASWMIQMGWEDVYVLENGISGLPQTQAPYKPHVLGLEPQGAVTARELGDMLAGAGSGIAVLDVASSAYHKQNHIPGAWWGIRSRLPVDVSKLPEVQTLVVTSEDGVLAHLAARDLKKSGFRANVLVLQGGTAGWTAVGGATVNGMEQAISEEDDAWYMPYMHPDALDHLKREYFEWEYGLVGQVKRDGTARFRKFPVA
ncbi:MAG: rhodanese-like domain-containing protein [Syntrophobacter sp.]